MFSWDISLSFLMGLRWFSNLFLQKGNAVEQLKMKLPIGVRLDKNAMLYNFAVFIILPKTEGFILSVKQIILKPTSYEVGNLLLCPCRVFYTTFNDNLSAGGIICGEARNPICDHIKACVNGISIGIISINANGSHG